MRFPQRISRWLKGLRGYTHRNDFSSIKSIVFFIGYPRSGHTLIGSLLDAHPEILISHELDTLYYYDKLYTTTQIDELSLQNSIAFTKRGRGWNGYNYYVPGQYQGKYRNFRIIGDKSGGRTARRMLINDFYQLVSEIQDRTNRKIIFIHVIRNPYDTITTMMKRTIKRRNMDETKDQLTLKIRHFFDHARGVLRIHEATNFTVIDIYHEDFVRRPVSELSHICEQLGLTATNDYLEACNKIVWGKPKTSRQNSQLWTTYMIDKVSKEMNSFPWFDRYDFDQNAK